MVGLYAGRSAVWISTDDAGAAKPLAGLLGSCVEAILAMPKVQARLENGQSAHEWVAGYLRRPETHPAG